MLRSRINPLLFRVENSLGPLELKVMKIIWGKEKVSVRDIVDILNKKKPIAYTTVMTVMEHLYQKKFLKREKNNKLFLYSPIFPKQNIVNKSLSNIFFDLFFDFGKRKVLSSAVGATLPDVPQVKPAALSATLTILVALFFFSSFDLLQNLSFAGTFDYLNLLMLEPLLLTERLHLFIPAFLESLPPVNTFTTIASTVLIIILSKKLFKVRVT